MTAFPQHVEPAARRPHAILSRLREAALTTLLCALVTGAWLAFFLFLPFDFTPPKP